MTTCIRGLTRATKNARFLKETAPDLFARDEMDRGFGTGVPLEVLRKLHRLTPDSPMLNDHPELASFLQSNPLPLPNRLPAREALFSGTVYFAQVTFNTSTGVKVVPTTDMNQIIAYAKRAIIPIAEYVVQQYGASQLMVSSTILTFSVNIPSASFTDGDLKGWVNNMMTTNNLGTDSCIFVYVPGGVSANEVGPNSGYHGFAKIPYIAAGLGNATNLTLQDKADVYAMVVSHEIAEMVVDMTTDLVNPEVCDPCDINCNNLTRVYFDTEDNFLGANQSSPPGGFTFDYYICAIVKSEGAANCPAAAADCQYAPVTRSLEFVMGQSTFSKDEVSITQAFAPAWWLQITGFTNKGLGIISMADLNHMPSPLPKFSLGVDPGLNAGNKLSNAQVGAIQTNLSTIAINFGPAPIIASDPSLHQSPQTFMYPYTLTFSSTAIFDVLHPGQAVFVTLSATLTVGSITVTGSANITLAAGANPRFENVDPAHPQAYPTWLSFDLRFFKVAVPSSGPMQTVNRFGADMSRNPTDAVKFIAEVIKNLTTGSGSAGGETFDGLTQDEEGSALEYLQKDGQGNLVFNFAVARVRLRGNTPATQAKKVRVFFRLFNAQSTVSNFRTDTTYRFSSDGVLNGKAVPLLGVENGEYVTVPCYASPRVNFNVTTNMYVPVSMVTQLEDSPNVQSITVIPGVEVDTFFGCWIDSNQPNQKWLPSFATTGNFDGPFLGTLLSINEAITIAPHQCLIAEIRDDDTPIPFGATTGNSDKLAQRNIAWIDGPNPGIEDSRQMPHPFDISATPPIAINFDQLIVFWGNTPPGSSASFYLPSINVVEIIELADAKFSFHQLISIDEHTFQCQTGGVTFIPLPSGTVRNAGLLTVGLPPGIKCGDRYDIIIRQTTVDSSVISPPPGIVAATMPIGEFSWYRTLGVFQLAIVISTKDQLILNESRLLAWLRYKLTVVSPGSRWFPVLQRYTEQIVGRLSGFGGDPGTISPSPTGDVPGQTGDDNECFTGKVTGIIYDRFGDFEGFTLCMQDGKQKKFKGHEKKVRELVHHALTEETLITICVDKKHHHDWPESFILH